MQAQQEIADTLDRLGRAAPAGYAMALHIRFTTPAFLFQTYDKEWIDRYSQLGLVMRDPTVRWGFENTGTVRWSALVAEDTEGVLAMAAAHGMRFGMTYATDHASSRSVTSFARAEREFSAPEIADICAEVDALHAVTARIETLAPETRAALRRMSVSFTHP